MRHLIVDATCICELGTVVDLSSAGVRLRRGSASTLEVGGEVPMWLGFGKDRMAVTARVAWERAAEGGGFELGLAFDGISEQDSGRIDAYLRTGHLPALAGVGGDVTASAQVELDDVYAVLGVPRTSGIVPIRRAYESLVTELELRARAGQIDERTRQVARERIEMSYRVLSDAGMRRRYDEMIGRERKVA